MTPAKTGSFLAPLPWDTEADLNANPGRAHLRARNTYVTVSLLAAMNRTWGGLVTAVKTATNTETGEVLVCRADPRDPDAVPLRRVGAQNAAEFSFHRPLTKLNLRIPASRQFVISPYIRTVEGIGPVFVFPIAKRISVPRGRKGTIIPSEGEVADAINITGDSLAQAAAAAQEPSQIRNF